VESAPLDVVNRWRAANFERDAVADVLADDVEWVVPEGDDVTTLRGVDAVLAWYTGGGVVEDDTLDVSEERGELEDLGDGRVGALNRLTYTSKGSGEVVQVKTGRLVYTVRNGKIARYELENLEDSEAAGRTSD
jgi:ketosteroid isomerase-like protein